ncbi:MAG: DUF3524 domain-containing protein [Planctomycetota bacterium]
MSHLLVLEPFGGVSHASLYRGWSKYSRHEFTALELPAVHWKWRSRHASLSLALQANELSEQGKCFDAVFCNDMLNLPEWRGFACDELAFLPALTYFHENQFTYPLAEGQTRDYHFAYTNILSLIASEATWFNSQFHLSEFQQAAIAWLRKMPDFKHADLLESALSEAVVLPPGIDPPPAPVSQRVSSQNGTKDSSRPVRLGWVSRWEHDKRPDVFVKAVEQLLESGIDFELILLGQQFTQKPASLQHLLDIAESRVLHAGFAESKEECWSWLVKMDFVISTADHEFLGIGICEAIAAGARPVLPDKLAYPEVLELEQNPSRSCFFYEAALERDADGCSVTARNLVNCLLDQLENQEPHERPALDVTKYFWQDLARRYDEQIEKVLSQASS